MRIDNGLVIGLSGKRGSGKTTVAEDLASNLGWKIVHFGRLVKSKAAAAGLGDSIQELQSHGAMLAKDPQQFCLDLLEFCSWNPGDNLIVDGIRHVEVADALEYVVRPSEFLLIAIKVDERTRLSRLEKRDGQLPKDVSRIDGHSTEAQVGTIIEQRSDLVITGDEAIDEIVLRIEEVRPEGK